MRKVLFCFLLIISFSNLSFAQKSELAPSEIKRKQIVEKMDKMGLRFRTKAVVEKSKKMLRIPESVKHLNDFVVAKTPPSVEFVIVPLENRFLPPVPKGYTLGTWSNWSQGSKTWLWWCFPVSLKRGTSGSQCRCECNSLRELQ